MRCEDALFRLWEFLDQELGPDEATAVRSHLTSCPHCNTAYCCDRAFLELLARQRSRCAAPLALRRFLENSQSYIDRY
ncbi:MAG: zf-HC2 domain-containing protein [Gemmatimonadales bacterium]|nr:zf-HC2 domain-containing protein [Gemmatimonadales bacterium]